MTLEDAQAWLLGLVKEPLTPYESFHINHDLWQPEKADVVPCCKLYGPLEAGGLLLTKEGDIAYFSLGIGEFSHQIDQPAPWWFSEDLRGKWRRTCWYTQAPPWSVSRWYRERGLE